MCDFSANPKSCCAPGNEPNENSCLPCFQSPTSARYQNTNDTCGLQSCGGQITAPCGSASCVGRGMGGVTCKKDICPYPDGGKDCMAVDCRRPDGTRCDAGGESCLRGDGAKVDYASKYKYTDLTKYTFNKNKYLPKSYLPGDGADYLQGYKSKIYTEESGLGGCGSYNCGMSSLDYVLQKLSAPIGFTPSINTGGLGGTAGFGAGTGLGGFGSRGFAGGLGAFYSAGGVNALRTTSKQPGGICGAQDCAAGLTSKVGQGRGGDYKGQGCGAPDCKFASNQGQGCGAPDCKFANNQGKGCGAPDCKFANRGKGCGAPDCKYANKGAGEICPAPCEDPENPINIGRQPKGDTDTVSCYSADCPFVKKKSRKACENPECPFAQEDKVECEDNTCPHSKKFVICQDCGGVVLDADQQEQVAQALARETLAATYASSGVKTSVEVEKIRGDKAAEKARKKEEEKQAKQKLKAAPRTSMTERNSLRGSIKSYKGTGDFETPSPQKNPETKSVKSTAQKPVQDSGSDSDSGRKKSPKPKEVDYTYPGVVLGHSDCMKKKKNIPSNMGWLWNIKPTIGNPELWRGYKPGAIAKTVHKMIIKHRRELGIYNPSDIIKKRKSKTSTRALSDKNKRVIQVKKKDGNYLVTLSPVKDPHTRHEFESPYVDCTPVNFRIVKPVKPQPPPPEPPENPCECPGKPQVDQQTCGSSDLSELDFNFSPPAALPVRPPKKKKIKLTKETQFDEEDAQKTKKPKPPSVKSDKSKKGKSEKRQGTTKKGKKKK